MGGISAKALGRVDEGAMADRLGQVEGCLREIIFRGAGHLQDRQASAHIGNRTGGWHESECSGPRKVALKNGSILAELSSGAKRAVLNR